jgi:hypothetical protein
LAVPSRGIADHAIHACEELSDHLSRVVGKTGVNTLFKRSAQQVAQWYPPRLASSNAWSGAPEDGPWLWLRTRLEQQDPETATEWFMLVLSMVVDLLMKLVDAAVVQPLLEDAWPIAFPHARHAGLAGRAGIDRGERGLEALATA